MGWRGALRYEHTVQVAGSSLGQRAWPVEEGTDEKAVGRNLAGDPPSPPVIVAVGWGPEGDGVRPGVSLDRAHWPVEGDFCCWLSCGPTGTRDPETAPSWVMPGCLSLCRGGL